MGGFDLDVSASPGFPLTPRHCSSLEFKTYSCVGHCIFVSLPPSLISRFIHCVGVVQSLHPQTALLLVVPV